MRTGCKSELSLISQPRWLRPLPDGMGGRQLGHGDVAGGLVGDERVFCRLLPVVSGGELGEVPVVVALHLVVEHFGLAGVCARDEVLVQDVEDVAADVLQLLLNLERETSGSRLRIRADTAFGLFSQISAVFVHLVTRFSFGWSFRLSFLC